jgi:hypothetical protein
MIARRSELAAPDDEERIIHLSIPSILDCHPFAGTDSSRYTACTSRHSIFCGARAAVTTGIGELAAAFHDEASILCYPS